MRVRGQTLHEAGARPARAAWAGSVTGEAASVATPTGRAPMSGRARIARAGLLAVAATLGVAASAFAFGALWPSGDAAPQPVRLSARDAAAARGVVAGAERLISITPAQLGYTLRVAGPLQGIRGRTDNATRTITLYVAPTDAPHVVAHDLGHEIGHAFDATRLTAAQRAAYLRARGVPNAPWLPGRRASDYGSGAGDFAEVFALCHAASPVYRSRLAAYPPDPCGVLPKQARGTKLGEGAS
jgi:hypothetical protein